MGEEGWPRRPHELVGALGRTQNLREMAEWKDGCRT